MQAFLSSSENDGFQGFQVTGPYQKWYIFGEILLDRYNLSMKYLLTLSLIVLTSFAISMNHQPPTRKPSSYSMDQISAHVDGFFSFGKLNTSFVAGHQFQSGSGSNMNKKNGNTTSATADLLKRIGEMTPKTCVANGYKRSNLIRIFNGLSQEIHISGNYQESGKVWLHGTDYISSKTITEWQFVKASGKVGGSNGILTIDLPQNTLVIFYQNPWSSRNSAGFCLYEKKNQLLSSHQLAKIYKQIHSSKSNPSANCKLTDNRSTNGKDFKQQLLLKSPDYTINADVKYMRLHGAGSYFCYTQQMNIIIG